MRERGSDLLVVELRIALREARARVEAIEDELATAGGAAPATSAPEPVPPSLPPAKPKSRKGQPRRSRAYRPTEEECKAGGVTEIAQRTAERDLRRGLA